MSHQSHDVLHSVHSNSDRLRAEMAASNVGGLMNLMMVDMPSNVFI